MNNQSTPLTDDQIIERLATEVMGWEEMFYPMTDDWWWNDSDDMQHDADWNPLTDWNDTMQLVEKAQMDGHHFESDLTSTQLEICEEILDSLPTPNHE